MRPHLLIVFALTVFVFLNGKAAPAEDIDPWSEKTVRQHFDQNRLQGQLDEKTLGALISHGETLFKAKFTTLDGAGRPKATQAIIPTKRKRPVTQAFQRTAGPDANSCASCHREPVTGGAGDFAVNAFVSEGFTNTDFDTTDPQFSNERNTNHLFGAGLIELLAREMTADLQATRRKALAAARNSGKQVSLPLKSKGVAFGQITAKPDGLVDLSEIDGVDSDLVIRPFTQKGVIVSLRQFTVNALNHHHGIQAQERFGRRWTGDDDFDADGKRNEMHPGDISALVAWQATRPVPVEVRPEDTKWQAAAKHGRTLFQDIGCAECHRPALPLNSAIFSDPGPLDAAGTLRKGDVKAVASYDLALSDWAKLLPRNAQGQIMVPLFGDLKRHRMTDAQIASLGNELMAQRFVDRNIFQTTELWGIASTAPYGHRGDYTTLDAVIRAHGGEGRKARDSYVDLAEAGRSAIIAFLKTLVIPE